MLSAGRSVSAYAIRVSSLKAGPNRVTEAGRPSAVNQFGTVTAAMSSRFANWV
jgi:hypothetical protein